VPAVSYARIQNLVSLGVLPLELVDETDHKAIQVGEVLASRTSTPFSVRTR
jgi:aconitase A